MFDINKFMGTEFTPREETIELGKEFDGFFPEGEKHEIKVRGLTGPELAKVHAVVDKNRNLSKIVEGLLSNEVTQEKIQAIREQIGMSDKTPDEIARRLEMFTLGVTSPAGVNTSFALKFCTLYPIDFYHITGIITKLTGQGSMPGKPKPSGDSPKSEQP